MRTRDRASHGRQNVKLFLALALLVFFLVFSTAQTIGSESNETLTNKNHTNISTRSASNILTNNSNSSLNISSGISDASPNLTKNQSGEFIFRINISGLAEKNNESFIEGTIETRYDQPYANSSDSQYNRTIYAVELDIYPGIINENMTICTHYVNMTKAFSCKLEKEIRSTNASYYTIIGITDHDGKILYHNQTYDLYETNSYENFTVNETILNDTNSSINQTANETINISEDEIKDKIPENISSSHIEKDIVQKGTEITERSFNLTLKFREKYEGRHIHGEVTVEQNETRILESIEINLIPKSSPSNLTICHYLVNGTAEFNCTLDNLISGEYEIKATIEREEKTFSTSENTFIDLPRPELRIETERISAGSGRYYTNDAILVTAKTILGYEIAENSTITLKIDEPGNSSYVIEDTNPEIGLIFHEPGNYTIRASTTFMDKDLVSDYIIRVYEPAMMEINRSYEIEDKIITDENASDNTNKEADNLAQDIVIKSHVESIYEKEKPIEIKFSVYLNKTMMIAASDNNTGENETNANNHKLRSYLTENISDILRNYEDEIITIENPVLTITDSNNISYGFNPRKESYNYSTEFFAIEEGDYDISFSILNKTIRQKIYVVNRSMYVKERIILPSIMSPINSATVRLSENMTKDINKTSGQAFKQNFMTRNITYADVKFSKSNSTDIYLEFEDESVKVILKNTSNEEDIESIQAITTIDDPEIATEVFSLESRNKLFNFSEADIILKKNHFVANILHCEEWNTSSASCISWKKTNIPFMQNDSHIRFNVTHFTAYVGGASSSLEIYDISDADKENRTIFINDTSFIYANYSTLAGSAIEDAICNISIDSHGIRNMSYEDGLYKAGFNITVPGFYSYNISCYEELYDKLETEDNITTYSYGNLTELMIKNTTLGVPATIKAKVMDKFNSTEIESYNVSFYSDISGYIGSSLSGIDGFAEISFAPDIMGIHTITANITDEKNIYYHAYENEIIENMHVFGTEFSIRKDIRAISSEIYNISISINNDQSHKIENITASDYVPMNFNPINYTIEPGWNVSSANRGTYLFWNISSIDPLGTYDISYHISYNETDNKADTKNMRIMGITNR
ncbi:MAG: hypothetical protein ACLFPQ_00260 [Candidatus Woesearchaeota archaeon]